MIKLLREGTYRLIETKKLIKILYLDNKTYAWLHAAPIGEIIVASRRLHKTDYVLSSGRYRLYEVDNEPRLIDQQHLELEVEIGKWQGYLLFTGLPSAIRKSGRILPTHEKISENSKAKKALALAGS
jgi:hypothetical protein